MPKHTLHRDRPVLRRARVNGSEGEVRAPAIVIFRILHILVHY